MNQQGSNQQNTNQSSNSSNNSSKKKLGNMKYEIANELGVNLKQGYNGDLTSREAGYVGGYMVKRMIEQVERSMSGQ
ncbi:MAG: alpha/beta-type small acid-soluble spore protein [Eubacteriales bacterium]